ncbi:MAG: YceI family protein [Sphingobium sp.]
MKAEQYSRSAIVLHWAIALLLLFQLGLGWHMMSMGQGAGMYSAFQFHKSVGILILVLSVARVGIRFAKPPPREVAMDRKTALLVKAVHFGLYAFMIGAPLTGWAVVSTAKINIPTRLFGVLPWPHLPITKAWHGLAELGHWALAWIALGLILLHLAGAIRHHLGKHTAENVIGRMIPVVAPADRFRHAIAAAIAAVLLLAAAFGLPWLVFPASSTPPVAAHQSEARARARASVGAAPAVAPAAEVQPAASDEAAEAVATETVTAQQSAKWAVMPEGKLGFVAQVNGTAVNGAFSRWTADIDFDPDALDRSKIIVRVPLFSAETGDGQRDAMLKGPDFFGASPSSAIFRSTAIRHSGGSRYAASGTLSISGASRPVTLAFTLVINGDRAQVTGSTKLDRTSFGIGAGEWAKTDQIAADVNVNFDLTARRQK